MIILLMYCVYTFMKMKSKRRTHEKEIYKFLEKQLREGLDHCDHERGDTEKK